MTRRRSLRFPAATGFVGSIALAFALAAFGVRSVDYYIILFLFAALCWFIASVEP